MPDPASPTIVRYTVPLRLAFAAYWIALLAGTHWPNLQIEGPVVRPDLYIHFAAFGGWTILCGLAAFFGPRWSARNIGLSAIASLAHAALNEFSQQFLSLGRTSALDDFGANAVGVLLGSCALLAIAWVLRARSPRQ